MPRIVSVVVGLIVLAGSRGSPAYLQVYYMTHMLRRYSAESGVQAEKKSSSPGHSIMEKEVRQQWLKIAKELILTQKAKLYRQTNGHPKRCLPSGATSMLQ